MPRRRYALILGFLVLLGLGVRVAFVFSYQETLEDRHAQLPPGSDPPLIGDSYFYFWVGRQIADGDGFVRPFELREHDRRVETAERPPLYPLVLAIPSALGARSLVDAGIFSALIGTATIVLIAALGRRVGGDAVGLVAAGIAAVYPTFWQPNGIVLSETLYVPLVAGMLLLAYQILDRPRSRGGAGSACSSDSAHSPVGRVWRSSSCSDSRSPGSPTRPGAPDSKRYCCSP